MAVTITIGILVYLVVIMAERMARGFREMGFMLPEKDPKVGRLFLMCAIVGSPVIAAVQVAAAQLSALSGMPN
jgi:hypothetical protein